MTTKNPMDGRFWRIEAYGNGGKLAETAHTPAAPQVWADMAARMAHRATTPQGTGFVVAYHVSDVVTVLPDGTPQAATGMNYRRAPFLPGMEHPFSISDAVRGAAEILGPPWSAQPGPYGTTGLLFGPRVRPQVIGVDEATGHLYMQPHGSEPAPRFDIVIPERTAAGLTVIAHALAVIAHEKFA
ncbi:hypothetical protein ACFV3E_40730 [Streptomyces sp. NPDC059718]